MVKLLLTVFLIHVVCQGVNSTSRIKIYQYSTPETYDDVNYFVDEFLTMIDGGLINYNMTNDQRFIKESVTTLDNKIFNSQATKELLESLNLINEITNDVAISYLKYYKKDQNVKVYWKNVGPLSQAMMFRQKLDLHFLQHFFVRIKDGLLNNYNIYSEIYKQYCETGVSELQMYGKIIKLINFAVGKLFTANILLMRFEKAYGIQVTKSSMDWFYQIVNRLFEHYVNIFKSYMLTASADVWSCSSYNQEHLELPVFKKYFITYHNSEQQCSDIGKFDKCHKLDSLCKKTRPCSNKLYCSSMTRQYINSTMDFTIACLNDNPNATKRYSSVVKPDPDNNSMFTCPIHNIMSIPHTSTSCDCICVEKKVYVSLQPQKTEKNSNYVVTGVKFVLEHEENSSTLHIQIQAGKLLKNGLVDNSTVTWNPIKKNNERRANITWKKYKKFDLSKIIIPKNNVITGVSFHDRRDDTFRLSLKLYSRRLNYTAGTLDYSNVNNITVAAPAKINLNVTSGKIHTTSTKPIIPTWFETSNYVELTTSNLLEDGGQTTIPFFDSQEVVTRPPAPLSGVDLVHLGQKGLAGVVSLKLNIFNFVRHIGSYLELPDETGLVAKIRDGWVIKVTDYYSKT